MYLDMVINALPDKGGNPILKDLERREDDSSSAARVAYHTTRIRVRV